MRLIRADASRHETMRKRIELHGSSFAQKGWGLLWLLQRLLGCSRAQRSPTGAWVTGDCFLGCGISPRCNRVVQGRIPLYVQLDKASMRLIRALFNFIELHGSSYYPKGLGFTLIAAEDAGSLPDTIGSYKSLISWCLQ